MLAYYTSLVKREEIVKKLSEDGNDLASLTNDLVCELKIFTAGCNSRNIETCLDSLAKASELSKVVSAMIANVEANYKSYVSSLLPQAENKEEADQPDQKQIDKLQTTDNPDQLKTLLETVKSLKEMKDSLGQ